MGGDALRVGRRRTGRASQTVVVSLTRDSTPGKGYEHPPTLHLKYGRLFLLVLSWEFRRFPVSTFLGGIQLAWVGAQVTVVECRTCNREVAGSYLGRGYCTSAVVTHYEKALYQACVPLPFHLFCGRCRTWLLLTSFLSMEVSGTWQRGGGGLKNTWLDCVKDDMEISGPFWEAQSRNNQRRRNRWNKPRFRSRRVEQSSSVCPHRRLQLVLPPCSQNSSLPACV